MDSLFNVQSEFIDAEQHGILVLKIGDGDDILDTIEMVQKEGFIYDGVGFINIYTREIYLLFATGVVYWDRAVKDQKIPIFQDSKSKFWIYNICNLWLNKSMCILDYAEQKSIRYSRATVKPDYTSVTAEAM